MLTLASRTGAYGGPLSVVLEQFRTRVAAGMTCTIYAGALRGDELQNPQVHSVEVSPLFGRSGFPLLFSWAMLRELTKAVRRSSAVHVSFARELVPIWAALLAVLLRRTLVLQPHGMLTVGSGSSRAKHVLDALVTGPLIRRATTVVALTSRERDALSRRYRLSDRVLVVIGNGLDLAREPYASCRPRALDSEPEMLFCARLHPRKRVTDFIAAAELLGDQVRAVVVGPDGGELEAVQQAANRGIVSYEPPVDPDRVADRVNGASVFVLCSEAEPFGNVLVTALALYIPVIVAQSADLAPIIAAAGAGIVVPDHSPEQIAVAVSSILASPESFSHYSRAAGALGRREFSQDVTAPLLLPTTQRGTEPS